MPRTHFSRPLRALFGAPGKRPLIARSLLVALLLVAAATLFAAGCSDHEASDVVEAARCDRLLPGTTYGADLDNDGTAEVIFIDDGRLTITDGDLVYQSRDKWKIVDSSLGDVDGDGFLEVATLVDDEEGRHIGLFAFFGGEYRERIVTSEIPAGPSALQVCDAERPGIYGDLIPSDLVGDLVVLTGGPGTVAGGPPTFFRWNGFGFTQMRLGDIVTQP